MTEIADIPIETIVTKLRLLAPALKAEGVKRLHVFGSRARGDARPDSDLDVLIETTTHHETPRFDYFKVLHLVEGGTGLRVQISDRESLKPRIAARIADDLIEVF